MNLKTCLTLFTRKFIAPTLAVLMFFAWAGWQLWQEHRALTAQGLALQNEQLAFYKARMAEKEQLLRWEKALELREKALIEQNAALENVQAQCAQAQERNLTLTRANSTQRQQEAAREQLHLLMAQFSATGVSLRRPPACEDKEGWRSYNTAYSLYSSASALAGAHSLTRDYAAFFNSNAPASAVALCFNP
ncbi:hypothetical protein J0B02_00630 [Enterobacteriaceae bacterium YMB-R22]|jgi:hypothetical protein|uniref:hypothetical protein n=1 Tax=Tenebrionicola larvae TaxID=2815733 RepID=UPI0020117188|nr:hypothetical protein [Tenebrionicola larvae]MBV4411364.1 hypothetical protein [Tenebrionicola larvae]